MVLIQWGCRFLWYSSGARLKRTFKPWIHFSPRSAQRRHADIAGPAPPSSRRVFQSHFRCLFRQFYSGSVSGVTSTITARTIGLAAWLATRQGKARKTNRTRSSLPHRAPWAHLPCCESLSFRGIAFEKLLQYNFDKALCWCCCRVAEEQPLRNRNMGKV